MASVRRLMASGDGCGRMVMWWFGTGRCELPLHVLSPSRISWWRLGVHICSMVLVEGLVPITERPQIGDGDGADDHGGIK